MGRLTKKSSRQVGAVVLIDGKWHGYRHNSSARLKVPYVSEHLQDVFDAFRQEVPYPREGRITRLIKSQKWATVESVKWCGGLMKCTCYDDGEVTAHKFRWEYSEIIERKVKVL